MFCFCHKPSPRGRWVSGWCMARLREASNGVQAQAALSRGVLRPGDTERVGQGWPWLMLSDIWWTNVCPEHWGQYCTTSVLQPAATSDSTTHSPSVGDTTQTPPESSRFPAQVIQRPWIPAAMEGREWGLTPGQSWGEMLPVNCFCLMKCSFSLQQQIRAIKH